MPRSYGGGYNSLDEETNNNGSYGGTRDTGGNNFSGFDDGADVSGVWRPTTKPFCVGKTRTLTRGT